MVTECPQNRSAAADLLEREMATDATAIIDRFISQNAANA
jgi:hypothetical protein